MRKRSFPQSHPQYHCMHSHDRGLSSHLQDLTFLSFKERSKTCRILGIAIQKASLGDLKATGLTKVSVKGCALNTCLKMLDLSLATYMY